MRLKISRHVIDWFLQRDLSLVLTIFYLFFFSHFSHQKQQQCEEQNFPLWKNIAIPCANGTLPSSSARFHLLLCWNKFCCDSWNYRMRKLQCQRRGVGREKVWGGVGGGLKHGWRSAMLLLITASLAAVLSHVDNSSRTADKNTCRGYSWKNIAPFYVFIGSLYV